MVSIICFMCMFVCECMKLLFLILIILLLLSLWLVVL